jgi:site-specific DNA-methyltransferase (adenine-specific)
MPDSSEKIKTYHYNNPMETFPGLSIDDLNRYLPAIQTSEDISMENENELRDGVFLSKCLDGMGKLPTESIDLIISAPPKENWDETERSGNTLQEYYQWNQDWIQESYRVLKNSGAIYIICPWQYSGMYQGLLSNAFQIQTRITWRDQKRSNHSKIWANETSDIWFATKTDEFLFKQHPIGVNTIKVPDSNNEESNLWIDIALNKNDGGRFPQELLFKILDASSFKLNWVLDPFMGFGDVGVACKNNGRRFIGFETNKDYLLLAMKRIDNS